jgi:hypothetical protein
MKKNIRTAYNLLMQMEVSGPNVKRVALAEQELEAALDIVDKMEQAEKAKAGAAKPAEEEEKNG